MKITSRNACWAVIVEALTALLEEQGNEPGEITPATMLNADLGISSVDAIHMMIMLEDRLNAPLSFEKLAVRDGEYVEDLSLAELLDFIADSLGIAA
jgi:acyl carrier protein